MDLITDSIFSLIQSIVGLGTLIVSIAVLLNTIRLATKDRNFNSAKEQYYNFLEKVDNFCCVTVNPQRILDDFSFIYEDKKGTVAEIKELIKEKNAELQKNSEDLRIQCIRLQLYIPYCKELQEIIISLIKMLVDKVLILNKTFIENTKNIYIEGMESVDEKSYNNTKVDVRNYVNYNRQIVAFIYEGLRLLQDYIFYGRKNFDAYIKEYEGKYKIAF